MDKFQESFSKYAKVVENFLDNYFARKKEIPDRLRNAMNYSLSAGGKRLRPVLCLAWANLVSGVFNNIVPFAAAIEMIHTYSLIHDDLPAMDDDDLRRGKPSCHKAFDEATAILAGDALLTDAFTVMTQTNCVPEKLLQAIRALGEAAGSSGMVGGQMLDMGLAGEEDVKLQELEKMESMKTGAMIKASCLCGAILGDGGIAEILMASQYGSSLGLSFQIVDDILDVTGDEAVMGKKAGNDSRQEKTTWPVLFGVEKSYLLAREETEKALAVLASFPAAKSEFLRSLALFALERKK